MNQTKVKLWTGQYTSIIISSLVMFAAFYMITSGFPLYVSTISNNPAIAGTLTTTLMTASLITRFFAIPPEKKVTANSMLLIFMDLGMAIGSVGLGYLAKYVGYGRTFGYSSISMIAILLIYLISSRRNASVK